MKLKKYAGQELEKPIITSILEKSPCPKCGKNFRQDCGYGVRTNTTDGADFDCTAPDVNGEPCDDCFHVWCNKCKKKNLSESFKKIEDHNVKVSKVLIYGENPKKTLKELKNWNKEIKKRNVKE